MHDQYNLVEQAQVDLTLYLLVVMEITQLLAIYLPGIPVLLKGMRPEENTSHNRCVSFRRSELGPFMPCWCMSWDLPLPALSLANADAHRTRGDSRAIRRIWALEESLFGVWSCTLKARPNLYPA